MSVLACDRYECPNIMCGRFSWRYNSYLCDECFEELVALGADADVPAFLRSEKPVEPLGDAARRRFEELFPMRD